MTPTNQLDTGDAGTRIFAMSKDASDESHEIGEKGHN